jgi:oxygen-independent coproporphyrinogen-3 oxidase
LIQRYVEALQRELERLAPHFESGIDTIFFGGGTPSLLTMDQWSALFRTMEALGLSAAGEWTVECNPATVSLDKAKLWRDRGVTRVSMGVQSLDAALLDRLGRVHTREMVFRSVERLRQGGIDNLNLDLMFAIPGQTPAIWRETMREAIGLGSEHLSCYEVIYEEDTPLFAQRQAGAFAVDEDAACLMYEALLETAERHGFVQYEIANFAKDTSAAGTGERLPSHACRHNVNYWRGGAYAAAGPSAAGFLHGARTRNVANTVLYCERIERGLSPVEAEERLPAMARAGEIAAFGLRMNTGWEFAEFHRATGFDLREGWEADMSALVDRGWALQTERRFRLSSRGMRFADAAAEMFLK